MDFGLVWWLCDHRFLLMGRNPGWLPRSRRWRSKLMNRDLAMCACPAAGTALFSLAQLYISILVSKAGCVFCFTIVSCYKSWGCLSSSHRNLLWVIAGFVFCWTSATNLVGWWLQGCTHSNQSLLNKILKIDWSEWLIDPMQGSFSLQLR